VTAVSAAGFLPAVSYASSASAAAVATGDFNGDGKTDLAVASPDAGYVRILLGNGDGTFSIRGDYYVGIAVTTIAVGDFNGDGKTDLAIGGGEYNYVVGVILGNGDGTFQAALFAGTPGGIIQLVAADFNGDGQVDLAGVGYQSAVLVVLLGNGDGTFQPAVNYSGGIIPDSLAVADFNGDGHADLVVTSQFAYGVTVLLGKGDGTFATPTQYTLSTEWLAAWVTTGDFNGDGKPDIAALSGGGSVGVLLGNGDGTFQPAVTSQYDQIAWAMVAADFNGDGILDLAFSNNIDGIVNVLQGHGDGSFAAPIAIYNSLGSAPEALAAGEFNGDGRTDLAVAIAGSGKLAVFLASAAPGISVSAGSLYFNVPINGATVTNTSLVATAAAGITVNASAVSAGWLSVQPNTFTGPTTLTVTANPTSLVAGLYSGVINLQGSDGSSAVVPVTLNVVNSNPSALSVTTTHAGNLTQGQTGAKYTVTVSNQAGVSQTSGVVTVTETVPSSLTLISMSGAGWMCSGNTCTRNDALAGGASYPAIIVTVNVAGGASSPLVNSVTVSGGGSAAATAADTAVILSPAAVVLVTKTNPSVFGQAAILTATVTPSAATGSVTFYGGTTVLGTSLLSSGVASLSTILLPAGSGTLKAYYGGDSGHGRGASNLVAQTVNAKAGGAFTAGRPFIGSAPISFAVADFNGDGKADIAVGENGGGLDIQLGDGLGNFQKVGTYVPGSYPYSIAVGDFNGDGKVDLAMANPGGNVSILLGNGDGTFQPPVNYAVGTYPYSIVVADFNGDGKADLAVGSLSILLGNGDGTFQPAVNYSVETLSLAVGDFNGDGNADLVGASDFGFTVILGNGDGTFQTPISYPTNSSVVAVGDFNGDGKTDIAVSDLTDDNVEILLSNGDGTFHTGGSYPAGTGIVCLTVGDFNGDGKADLAVGNQSSDELSVTLLLGNGDGTFQAVANYLVGANPPGLIFPQLIAVGEFNGDGRADLAVGSAANGSVSILLGALPPVLTVSSTHTGNFAQGQSAATYTITVTNQGATATNGTVTVTETIPAALTLVSMTGTGWSCTGNTCTRSDVLNIGFSYPPITVTVNVGPSASSPQVNSVTVSGGGSATASATDSTVIQATGTAPSAVSVAPSSGSGAQQTFALQYADPLGVTDLTSVWVWFTANFNSTSSANSCMLYYARATNQLFFLNDAGTAWSSPVAPGAAVTLSNSQCSVNVGAASVTPSGTDLIVNLPVTFTAAYAGTKSTYMYAAGSSGNSGWQLMGSWTAPPPAPVLSVFSTHGGNFTQGQIGAIYTVTVSNQMGAVATSGTVTVTDTLPAGLTLTSMTGTGWTCTGNTCTRSDVLNIGATYPAITVTVNVSASAGSPQVNSVTVSGGGSATASATDSTVIQVVTPPPTAVSVAPNSGSGAQQTFALQYADPLGAADLTSVWVWFTANFSSGSAANSCMLCYARATNQLFFLNDAGTAWSSPVAPGAAVTLSNSQCSVNVAAASVTASGTDLTVNLPVMFTTAYAGAKSTYMYAAGSSANSGWQAMGTWTVPAAPAVPVLSIASAHSGSFMQGQTGATYAVTVSNQTGLAATSGTVAVTDTLPTGLTLTSMMGSGWTCINNTCTRSDILNAGSSYPAIVVTVDVGASASSPQVNSVSVSGGGSATASATDSTAIQSIVAVVSAVSVTPSSGAGLQQTFALQYTDSLGATDLTSVWVWFTSNFNSGSAANSCMLYYARATNQLYFLNDAGTAWSSPVAPGAAVTLSNSQCSINVAAASVTASGTDLIVNLPVTFTAAYAGAKNTYMYAAGSSANSGWQPIGSWTVPVASATAPSLSVASAHTGNFTQGQIGASYTVIVSNQTSAGVTSGAVIVTDTLPTGLTLSSMTGTGWTCTSNTCSRGDILNAGASYPAITVTVNVAASASSPQVNSVTASGGGSAAASATDSTAIQSIVAVVSAVSVTPTSGAGLQQAFALQYADSLGATDLTSVWVWFTSNFTSGSAPGSCMVYYARATNQLYFLNDAGAAWSSAVAPGAAVTLSNSQCSINVAAASVTSSGTNLTLNLPVTFTAAYAGAKNTYMYAAGSSANSGWHAMGSWTVPAASAPVLSVASAHSSSFTQGQTGATYTVTVSNQTSAGVTSGAVIVTDTLPTGLTLSSMTGTGWTCTSNACSRSDVLDGGASYPAIAVTVNVGASASSPQVNSVSVSGGGSATFSATDSTAIQSTVTAVNAVSVTPSSGTGLQQAFALQYADSLGATDLASVWVWFTANYSTVSAPGSCMVYYARATNQLFFLNDAGTTWSSPVAPGAAVTLSNSQCSINVAAASVTSSGTYLTLNLPMTFAPTYGAQSTYMYAAGSSSNSGWQALGSWTP
jgi:large repetitive protein